MEAAAALARAAAAIDDLNALHVPPGLPAEGAGVHRQCPTQRAGNSGEEVVGLGDPDDLLRGGSRLHDALKEYSENYKATLQDKAKQK